MHEDRAFFCLSTLDAFDKFFRQNRHSPVLCAYKSTHIYRQSMGFGNRKSGKYGCCKRARKRVARPYSIGNLYLWRLSKRHAAGRKHITTVHTARKYEHIQIVFAEDEPTFILDIQSGIAEHTADCNKFFIVDLKHIAKA